MKLFHRKLPKHKYSYSGSRQNFEYIRQDWLRSLLPPNPHERDGKSFRTTGIKTTHINNFPF